MKSIDKNQRLILKITFSIVLIILATAIILFYNKGSLVKKGQFIIPEVEKKAILGMPDDIPEEYMYQEVKVNDDYIVYLCSIPTVKDNKLTIYFTSVKTNKGLIRIKVLDSKNNIIGESGLLNPNSYVKEILLSNDLYDNEIITIKVMNYEKDTYYSLGEIKLDLFIKKITG